MGRVDGGSRLIHGFPGSGWYRIDHGDATVFWHIEPDGSPDFASHGHCDTGSFCLYVKGVPILVDPGRLNYRENDALGIYGISARAHNNVLVDDYEPFLYWRRSRFPAFFRRRRVEVDLTEEHGDPVFSVRHDGFSRLGPPPIVLARKFRLHADRLVIDDWLDGASAHTISTYFQWAPHVTLSSQPAPDAVRIHSNRVGPIGWFRATPAADMHVARGMTSPAGGWYFPEYGEKTESSTLVCRSRTRLPYTRTYTIDWSS